MMQLTIFTLISIIGYAVSQYAIDTGLRADVTFGEHNDRFDITNLIRRQTKHLKPNLDPQSEEYRRRYKKRQKNKIKTKTMTTNTSWSHLLDAESGSSLRKKIKEQLEDHVNSLANTIINKIRGMRRNEEFTHHDNMNSEGGDIEEFYTNLHQFERGPDLDDDKNRGNNINAEGSKDFNTNYLQFDRRRDFNEEKIRDMSHYKGFSYNNNINNGGGKLFDTNTNLLQSEKRRHIKDEDSNDASIRRQNRLQAIVNKLHGTHHTRRSAMDPEKEIAFHYAFPLDMKIEGFLQPPLI